MSQCVKFLRLPSESGVTLGQPFLLHIDWAGEAVQILEH